MNAPDHAWHDISALKRKFGGVEVELMPTLDYGFGPEAYDRCLALQSRPRRRLRSSGRELSPARPVQDLRGRCP